VEAFLGGEVGWITVGEALLHGAEVVHSAAEAMACRQRAVDIRDDCNNNDCDRTECSCLYDKEGPPGPAWHPGAAGPGPRGGPSDGGTVVWDASYGPVA